MIPRHGGIQSMWQTSRHISEENRRRDVTPRSTNQSAGSAQWAPLAPPGGAALLCSELRRRSCARSSVREINNVLFPVFYSVCPLSFTV
ncbi:hypothetical protein SRHO_G00101710 [Serrasalmus rhombeus]